uniref:KIB1-4 beta-propeller domain-containing protein n=1 Tax=Oryza glumipatula TaxID=40148 RepID=A0A0E0B0K4_9ORYZ
MEVKQVKVTAAAAEAATSSWSELPADLIGQVLLRLPSLADRVRLRAACRPWRTDAKRQAALPPPLPWFALRDGGLVDHHGAPVRRCAPILREGVTDYLAVDNLAFLAHNRAACCSLVILSSPPLDSSPDPLVAALIFEGYYVAISACKRQDVAGFGSVSDWTRKEIHRIPGEDYRMRLADIAFLNGRLYALTVKEGLYVFEPNSGDLDDPMNAPSGFRHCIIDNPEQQEVYTKTDLRYVVARYLAECDGRLFMVRRWMRVPLNVRLGDMDETFSFEVFEADLTTTPCQWRKVDRLGGHAIFLGSECTKVVRASKCVGGVQEDCIYFMHRTFDNPSREYFGPCVDPLGDSGVYNMTNRRITPLLPEAVMEKLCLKRQFLTWFFPADV